jgi:hypothetical protein
MIAGYHLGCALWAFEGWAGNLDTRDATPRHFL